MIRMGKSDPRILVKAYQAVIESCNYTTHQATNKCNIMDLSCWIGGKIRPVSGFACLKKMSKTKKQNKKQLNTL